MINSRRGLGGSNLACRNCGGELFIKEDDNDYKCMNCGETVHIAVAEVYAPPPLDLLAVRPKVKTPEAELSDIAVRLEQSLSSLLHCEIKVNNFVAGSAVIHYEFKIPRGVSANSIVQCEQAISRELAIEHGVRMISPVHGTGCFAVEVPRKKRSPVDLRDVIGSAEFLHAKSPTTFALGEAIDGEPVVCDLSKSSNILVAGRSAGEKYGFFDCLIVSLLYKSSPDDVRLVFFDFKKSVFVRYEGVPHALYKTVADSVTPSCEAIGRLLTESDRRYRLIQSAGYEDIDEYNRSSAVANGKQRKLPHIVMLIAELADIAGCDQNTSVRSEIQRDLCSIGSIGRKTGIHIVVATEKPSDDVSIDILKTFLVSRVAFATDDEGVLDSSDAGSMLGGGDMLYRSCDMIEPVRLQGASVAKSDADAVVSYLKKNCAVRTDKRAFMPPVEDTDPSMDPLLPRVMAHAIKTQSISTSVIQRRFSIGFARAARIIDYATVHGYISDYRKSHAHEVFMTVEQYREIFGVDPE